MVLQVLSNFAYQLVEQSWIIATVLVKYFLLVVGAKIVWKRKFETEYITDQLIEYSGELVGFIALLGLINVFVGFSLSPVFTVFSQVTAFLYFAFLFWIY